MGIAIFNTIGMADAMRHTDYETIYSAISEIVDNSIEAKAKNIAIILYVSEKYGTEIITKMSVLDDGTGMDESVLQNCLVFGSSTKNGSNSIGRFGVGLGQASLFASSRVEVYSWQNSSKPKMVYLDTDKMRKGEQKEIASPLETDFPAEFATFGSIQTYKKKAINFLENGTMIVWNKVDKINNRVPTFRKKLLEELGRRFRYYISQGVNIYITDTAYSNIETVREIDPMFLMPTSLYLGSRENNLETTDSIELGEPIFEPLNEIGYENGSKILRVTLDDIRDKPTIFGNVVIRASYVKEKFYYQNLNFDSGKKTNPGETKIGKLVKKFEEISVLRVKREIQFAKFDLYDSVNTPTNRWWSIEIEFDNSLDELFKLSNNKQKVEINTAIYTNFIKEGNSIKRYHDGIFESKEEQFWFDLVNEVKSTIKYLQNKNKKVADKYLTKKAKQQNSIDSISDSDNNVVEKISKDLDGLVLKVKPQLIENLTEVKKGIETNVVYDFSSQRMINFSGTGLTSKIHVNKSSDLYLFISNLETDTSIDIIFAAINEARKKFNTYESSEYFERFVREMINNLEKMKGKI